MFNCTRGKDNQILFNNGKLRYREVKYFAERPSSVATQQTFLLTYWSLYFLTTGYRFLGAEPPFCSLFILPIEKQDSGI